MELKATDLRVGNWVNRKYYNPEPNNEHWALEHCLLGAINIGGRFNVKLKNGGHSIVDYLEPIPLTEDWLVEFGFVKNELASREFIEIYGDKEFKVINHYENGWLVVLNWWHAGVMIQFVHQLQNLIYALTGQDL